MRPLRILGVALLIAGMVGLGLGIGQISGAIRDVWADCTPSYGKDHGYYYGCENRDWVKRDPAAASNLWSFMSLGILWGPGLSITGASVWFSREEGPSGSS